MRNRWIGRATTYRGEVTRQLDLGGNYVVTTITYGKDGEPDEVEEEEFTDLTQAQAYAENAAANLIDGSDFAWGAHETITPNFIKPSVKMLSNIL